MRRVLVVFEPGPRGASALLEGAALARGGEMTVLALAPTQAVVRCGPSDDALEQAVIEAAEAEHADARRLLADADTSLSVVYETLVNADARSLAALITERGTELVVVPRRRLIAGGHIRVSAVRRRVSADVVVAAAASATQVATAPARSRAGSTR